MKRDWDVVRTILLKVEESDPRCGDVTSYSFDGIDPVVAGYHIIIMADNRLLDIQTSNSDQSEDLYFCHVRRMTWEGQEFLDKIRSQSVWNKTVDLIKNKGGELTFDTIKVAAGIVMTNLLE